MNAKLAAMCERLVSLSQILPSDDKGGWVGTNENRTYILGQIAVLSAQVSDVAAVEARRLMDLRAEGLKPIPPK